MPTLFKRYRTVLFYHRNLKLLEPPYFLMAEWMALKMVFATLCLGLVRFLYAQAGESGLLQVDPASYSYHMAQVFMCLVTAPRPEGRSFWFQWPLPAVMLDLQGLHQQKRRDPPPSLLPSLAT